MADAESTLQNGLTASDEPSLNHAVAVYCAVLLALITLAPFRLSEVNEGGGTIWVMDIDCVAVWVVLPIVALAEIVLLESDASCPTVKSPELDMLPGPEMTDHVGDTDCEEPSL